MKIIPAGATIAELKKKAAELEEQAESASKSWAAQLLEKAKLCRKWIAELKSGKWSS